MAAPVAVLMPVYNAERYVAEAVESILAQTFTDFEFLIIDDGSTDGSLAILKRYAERDGRIRLISRPNTGIVGVLNEGLELTQSEFVARMDADDMAMPERLDRQLGYLRAHPECMVVGSRVLLVDSDGDPIRLWSCAQTHEEIDSALLNLNEGAPITHSAVTYRREAVLAVGKYKDRAVEDLDLFLRLAERGRLVNLPDVLIKYRHHPGSLCHDGHLDLIPDSIRLSVTEAYKRRGLDADRCLAGARSHPISTSDVRADAPQMGVVGPDVGSRRDRPQARVGAVEDCSLFDRLLEASVLCAARTLNLSCPSPDGQPLKDTRVSVAFFCPSWPPGDDSNGIVTYVGTITRWLREQGHQITVFAPCVDRVSARTEEAYDLSRILEEGSLASRFLDRLVTRIDPTRGFDRRICRPMVEATGRAIADHRVQIVEMEESFGWAHAVGRRIPVPMVVRLHGPWFLNGPANGHPDDATLQARVRKEERAIRSADGITAPSRDVLERTRAYYGLPLEHAEVIPYPLPDIPSSERWSAAGCDHGVILFIGRFDRHKGGDLIIDAFTRVVARFPNARLRFVGQDRGFLDGNGRKWTILDYIDARAPGLRHGGQIEWLDRQPHAAVAGMRRKAAVTVVCSRYETFGLTATEAMSQGCPLVAAAAGALAEIVQDGVNGLVCRPDDPEDLAEKLCLLLENRPYAERLGSQAAEDSRRRYDPGLLAARSVDYYQRVIARARTKHSTSRTHQ